MRAAAFTSIGNRNRNPIPKGVTRRRRSLLVHAVRAEPLGSFPTLHRAHRRTFNYYPPCRFAAQLAHSLKKVILVMPVPNKGHYGAAENEGSKRASLRSSRHSGRIACWARRLPRVSG